MLLRIFGASDQGMVRTNNQDSFFFSEDYGIVIVSDGMGGHRGGKIASTLVVNGLKEAYLATQEILAENMSIFLDDALRKINEEILRQSRENENLRGMGATVNYLQIAGGVAFIGHAGDSRTYLLRAFQHPIHGLCHGMWQLTIDHNVGTFVERGLLELPASRKSEPLTERERSRLVRGMGVLDDLHAELYMRKLLDGDVFLTCSDGLHGFVSDDQIVEAIGAGELSSAPERLIHLVKKAGAPDNVTVVISVLSDRDEPLANPLPECNEASPFLIRTADYQILGPMNPGEVVSKLQRGEIPLHTEVSASLDRWVFLDSPFELLATYPAFDLPEFHQISCLFASSQVSGAPNSRHATGWHVTRVVLWTLAVLLLITVAFLYLQEYPARIPPE